MELEKIEELKKLIKKRDSLLKDLEGIKYADRDFGPNEISFKWVSGYIVTINIPREKKCEILKFLEDLYKEELEKTNNLIKEI